MRIALAQINPTVGELDANARLIAQAIGRARDQGARLVVLPELAIIGYPPRDLLLKPAVIERCRALVESLAEQCVDIAAVIGYPAASEAHEGLSLHNAAALCDGGRVVHRYVKRLLPTYDVFDERRYFEPASSPSADLARLDGVGLGVSICEDLWNDGDLLPRRLYHDDPIGELARSGAGVLVNCSASPFVLGKQGLREKLFGKAARAHHLPLIYCNQVGGNDELIFDGASCVFDAQGDVIARAKAFEEDLLIVDVPLAGETAEGEAGRSVVSGERATVNRIEPLLDDLPSACHALTLGLRDYCRKCGFPSIVLGLSGGIDSALTCALAVAAVGPENVVGVAMPSRFSSEGSINDARALAENLNITFHVVPIDPAHQAVESMVAPCFEGLAPDVTEENIQARLRGVTLMAFSNKLRSLLVTTGNKSELAVGYCTLYGDMCGGLAVLSDVPKTMVWELSRWINQSPDSPLRRRFGLAVIPDSSITKPPSAELRPDQKDEDSLPPYAQLDAIIERYVEREQSAGQIIEETGMDADTVLRMVQLIDRNEYKRKQAAPGLKITARAFGFGRRMPIAQRYDNRHTLAPTAEVNLHV